MADNKRLTVKQFFNSFRELEKDALYIVDYTTEFKKNVKLCYRRNLDLSLLRGIIEMLAKTGILSAEYSPHALKGYRTKANEEVMECHIQSDWLLVWKQNDTELTLILTASGTHSDLFGL